MRSSNQPPPQSAPPPKTVLTNTSPSTQCFYSPSSFWPKTRPSLSVLCHQIETCQARGKRWRMEAKNPLSSGRNKPAAFWRVGSWKTKKIYIFCPLQVTVFCVLECCRRRKEASESATGREVVLPWWTLFTSLFGCKVQPSCDLKMESTRQLCPLPKVFSLILLLLLLQQIRFFCNRPVCLCFSLPVLFGTAISKQTNVHSLGVWGACLTNSSRLMLLLHTINQPPRVKCFLGENITKSHGGSGLLKLLDWWTTVGPLWVLKIWQWGPVQDQVDRLVQGCVSAINH